MATPKSYNSSKPTERRNEVSEREAARPGLEHREITWKKHPAGETAEGDGRSLQESGVGLSGKPAKPKLGLRYMNWKLWLLALMLPAFLSSGCDDATGITWHSYIHQSSGQIHFSLHLASYKRGLFFGSCGPSTRSLQWEYYIELKGNLPSYTKGTFVLKDGEYHRIAVDSGYILFDRDKRTLKIDIAVIQNSNVQQFMHNGVYRMQKEP
jgi:hypothetical protein